MVRLALEIAEKTDRNLLPVRAHDGPTDPQQRLASVHHPLQGTRHFGAKAPETPDDIGRRRAGRIGGAPDHDAAALVELVPIEPRRSLRRYIEIKVRPADIER